MAKANKPSMPPEALTKSGNWSDWLAPEAFRLFPGKDEWRQRLKFTLLQWYETLDEDDRRVLDIMDFCIKYKIPYRTLKRYVDMFPDLGEIYSDVKQMLGYRKRIGAYRRTLDNSVFKDMHVLDPEWHEVNKYHADLQAQARKDADLTGDFIINIPPMPKTTKVKEKKK